MTPSEAVQFMVEHKILSLKTPDGLEISLHPEALASKGTDVKDDDVDGPDLDERGSTGMTRREQDELFGQTFEGDFAKGR